MSLWQDEKYVRLVSSQLDRFTQKSSHHFLFRCPLCGDSEKNQYKARGYIYPKGDDLMFKCHNCSICLPFTALLKKLSRPLYDEYLMERFREHTRPGAPDANGILPNGTQWGTTKVSYKFVRPEPPVAVGTAIND